MMRIRCEVVFLSFVVSTIRHICLLGLCLFLAACSGLGGGKELATFDLSAPTEFSGLSGRSNRQILIPAPTALKSLDSEMIVVRPNDSEITYFGDAQWSDRLPKVVQDKLIQTIENSRRVASVAKPGDGVVVDYKIATVIRHFELVATNGGQAVIEISAKIINDRNGRVRASKIFRTTAPASLSSAKAGITGLDAASDQIFGDMLAWIVRIL